MLAPSKCRLDLPPCSEHAGKRFKSLNKKLLILFQPDSGSALSMAHFLQPVDRVVENKNVRKREGILMFSSKNLMVMALIFLLSLPLLALAEATESGSARINFSNTVFVGSNELKPGVYNVEWQTNSPEATVIFKLKGAVAAKVPAKIEKADQKVEYDASMTAKAADGRDILKTLRFSKKQIKIIFE